MTGLLVACSGDLATRPQYEALDGLAPSLTTFDETSEPLSFAVDRDAPPGVSVFLRYDRERAPADRVGRVLARDASFVGDVEPLGTLAIIVPESEIAGLAELPWVLSVERGNDTGRPASAAERGVMAPYLSQVLPWGVDHIEADQVHAGGNRGSGVTVAVLDTGIDCTHPDLSGRIVGGYDYILGSSNYCQVAGAHGTSVSGTFAATDDNGGVVGVSPLVNLRMYRVCTPTQCFETHMYYALWAASYAGAQVMNVSIVNCGADAAPSMLGLLSALYQVGRVIVFAGGNGQFTPCAPGYQPSGWARSPHTLAASAVDPVTLDTANAYSYGPAIDFAAPHDVFTDEVGGGIGGGHRGTSFAAPHLAGAVALMLATGDYSGLSGSQIPIAIKNKLIATADDMGPIGKDNFWGYGIIDALGAVSTPPPPPLSVAIMGPFDVPPDQACQWQAVVSGGSAPYSYQWSGALYGSGISVSGLVTSSSYLYLTVTDAAQAQDSDQFFIFVDEELTECVE